MITSGELEKLADIAVEKYLKDNVPLNASIVKLANDNALNNEQIKRIVESANTNVYVKLYNESQNKYIEFPNADSEKIALELHPPKDMITHTGSSDYFHEPIVEKLNENISIFGKQEEKKAEITEQEVLREYYKLASAQERINNAIIELESCFETELSTLKNLTKQAVLQGTSFDKIVKGTATLFPDPLIKSAFRDIHKNFVIEKIASGNINDVNITASIDPDHPIVKQIEKLIQVKQAYFTVLDKQVENLEKVEKLKTASVGTVVGKVLQNPGVFAAGVGVGALGGIAGYAKIKKVRERQMNSPLNTVPQSYQRNQ